jgi:hypothetical protein
MLLNAYYILSQRYGAKLGHRGHSYRWDKERGNVIFGSIFFLLEIMNIFVDQNKLFTLDLANL